MAEEKEIPPENSPPPEVNFMQGYVELNSGTEVPPIFATWCGISGVSCVLGRNVWIDMGTFVIFPNLYICLVGESGRIRKGTAIMMIDKILRRLSPPPLITSEKTTTEGLIDTLKKAHKSDTTGAGKEAAVGFCIAEELSVFLNRNAYEAGLGPVLIKLFDCRNEFSARTMSRGEELIKNSCFGLLAGSTIEGIKKGIPEQAVGEGLTSRIIFVYCRDAMPPVAVPSFGPAKRQLLEDLIKGLQRISTLKGEFQVSQEALEFYVPQYESFQKSSPFFDMMTLSGYASRRFIHMFKLGMVFSACESGDKIVKRAHLELAVEFLSENEKHLPMVMNLITSSDQGNTLSYVYNVIKRRGKIGISRSELLRTVSHRVNAMELNIIIETLISSERICAVGEGRTVIYVGIKE